MRRARGARDAAGVFSLTTGGPRAAEGACPASGETAPWGNAETGHRVRGRGRRVVRAERAARSNVDETRASGNAGLGADLGARRAVRARRGGREKRGGRGGRGPPVNNDNARAGDNREKRAGLDAPRRPGTGLSWLCSPS